MNTTQELGKAMYETICVQGRLIQELQDQLANCARLKNPQTAAENVLVGNSGEQGGQIWPAEHWAGYQQGLAERAAELESKKRISEAWKAECDRLGNACDRLSKELAQAKQWKEEDPRMLRKQIEIADRAFHHLNEEMNKVAAQRDRLIVECESLRRMVATEVLKIP